MDSQKFKHYSMILHTNIAIGPTNFIGTMNHVHYVDNQFNLNFQTIFITCCEQLYGLVLIFITK